MKWTTSSHLNLRKLWKNLDYIKNNLITTMWIISNP